MYEGREKKRQNIAYMYNLLCIFSLHFILPVCIMYTYKYLSPVHVHNNLSSTYLPLFHFTFNIHLFLPTFDIYFWTPFMLFLVGLFSSFSSYSSSFSSPSYFWPQLHRSFWSKSDTKVRWNVDKWVEFRSGQNLPPNFRS